MAGFTDEEISGAIGKLIQARTNRDQSGQVDIGLKFEDTRQLAALALATNPYAIFYLAFLLSNKINQKVCTLLSTIDDMLQAVVEVGRTTKKIENTNTLGDALTTLLLVDRNIGNKKAVSQVVLSGFTSSIDAFANEELAPNVRHRGSLVRPPQEANKVLLDGVSLLEVEFESVLELLGKLTNITTAYASLDLSAVYASNTVSAVRRDLEDIKSFLDGDASEDEKIASSREILLRLLANKSVMRQCGAQEDALSPKIQNSPTRIGSAVALDLKRAEMPIPSPAPWVLSPGAVLALTPDGGSEVIIVLPVGKAKLISSRVGPYAVPSGATIVLDSRSPSVQLTPGSRTASEVASDIMSWVAAYAPGAYFAYASSDALVIESLATGDATLTISGDADVLSNLGFYPGQSDSVHATTSWELAAAINATGKLSAEVVVTRFASGISTNDTLTRLLVPSGPLTVGGHVGDSLVITSGVNAGTYKIQSVTSLGGLVAINIYGSFKQTTTQTWQVVRESVIVRSLSSTTASSIAVGNGSANSALGLENGRAYYGQTLGFQANENGSPVDFSASSVSDGDLLYIGQQTIPIASVQGTTLQLATPISSSTTGTFEIRSGGAVAYEALRARLRSWYARLEKSPYATGLGELARVVNVLIHRKHPTLSSRADATSALRTLRSLLSDQTEKGLQETLLDFAVPYDSQVDAVLKMLLERGMNRAYDFLVECRLEEFFSMSEGDVSSSAYLMKTMRDVVNNDLPISPDNDYVDTRLDNSYETDDSDFSVFDTDIVDDSAVDDEGAI